MKKAQCQKENEDHLHRKRCGTHLGIILFPKEPSFEPVVVNMARKGGKKFDYMTEDPQLTGDQSSLLERTGS